MPSTSAWPAQLCVSTPSCCNRGRASGWQAVSNGYQTSRRAPVVDVHERLVPHEQRAHDLQRRDLQREVEWLRAQAVPKIRV